ncbi:interferon gamma receptor 2 [Halichoeres trimaculatus]|uniref:interferon gamma receptor 2 n=1 Tax=Halichoeres trimaculatus TaxID=147232 RepID=UPI003D9FABA6
MIFMVFLIQTVLSAPSKEPPAPPQHVHLNNSLLTWTPPPGETGLTYTVQRSFFSDEWTDVPTCVNTSSTSCNVPLVAAKSEDDCVRLEVEADRLGLTSEMAQACSLHSDFCTPEVSVSARPGSLTVHLSRNHKLVDDYEAHLKHRVYFGKEGETLQSYKDSASTITLPKLQEGQRYCVQVEFILHNKPVGPPTCPQCKLIPHTDAGVNPGVIVGVVLVLSVLIITSAYVLICQIGRIKSWLRPPYEIPDDFFLQRPLTAPTPSPTDEHFDVISSITPEEQRG